MGICNMTESRIFEIIESMRPKYSTEAYNVVHHNCHDFSIEFIDKICPVCHYFL